MVTSQTRHAFIRALDVLGKWSLIDMYVLCIMVIAFPVHVVVLGWDIQVLVEVCANLQWFPKRLEMTRVS
jgi:uncharacterized paraquat-inducible protein A